MRTGRKQNILRKVFLTIIAIIYIIPVYMMLIGSLKDKEEAVYFNLSFPSSFHWENYAYVIEKGHVFLGYFNSILLTCLATLLVILFGSLTGIYVGRRKGNMASFIYDYFIIGLTVSFQTATTFALLKGLHLYGNRLAVILIYAGTQLPFTVMTFSSFVKGVSREIDDAALIDGCNVLSLIFRILLPIMKPIMITNLIVTAISCWNNFMIPLFYLDSASKWPIPLLVYNFFGRYARNWNFVFAMLVLTISPVVLLYLCLQKYIVEGMTAGAVKG